MDEYQPSKGGFMQYQRFIFDKILDALTESPVILVNGARQTGKTTLVQYIADKHFPAHYISLDDLTIRGAAKSDPQGFLDNYDQPIVIDEIQIVPDLLPTIKLRVDRDRRPGKFILTGSANVLTLPTISESLAGRMEIFTLYPLSQGELIQKKERFIDWIFSDKIYLEKYDKEPPNSIWQKVATGGFPEIIKRERVERREAWFRDYISTILQRDIRDLSNIEGLTQMPRLLELLATRVTSLLNFAELSRTIQIPQTSLKRYMTLFDAIFLIHYLSPWSGHLGKRIIKTPKLFFIDTGLAAYLLGTELTSLIHQDRSAGALLENFVLSELIKHSSWSKIRPNFYHFRSQTGIEVDFILEDRRRRCVGIEVKTAATVRHDDFKGLRWLKENLGDQFLRGIVLYSGEEMVAFGDGLFTIPVQSLWKVSE